MWKREHPFIAECRQRSIDGFITLDDAADAMWSVWNSQPPHVELRSDMKSLIEQRFIARVDALAPHLHREGIFIQDQQYQSLTTIEAR